MESQPKTGSRLQSITAVLAVIFIVVLVGVFVLRGMFRNNRAEIAAGLVCIQAIDNEVNTHCNEWGKTLVKNHPELARRCGNLPVFDAADCIRAQGYNYVP